MSKLEFSESQVCKTIWTNLRRFFGSSGELLENASRPTGSCSMHGWLKILKKLLRFWAVNGSNFLAETRTGIQFLIKYTSHIIAEKTNICKKYSWNGIELLDLEFGRLSGCPGAVTMMRLDRTACLHHQCFTVSLASLQPSKIYNFYLLEKA